MFQSIWSYITRHWRGQLTLPMSYWVNFFIPKFIFGVLDKINPSPEMSISDWFIAASELIWLPWALVGVWRSASWKGWGIIARLFVIWQAIVNIHALTDSFLKGFNGS